MGAFHDFTHIGFGCGGGVGDCLGDDLFDLLVGEGCGEVFRKDVDFVFFVFGEFGAICFFELFDGVLALFDLFADDGEDFGFVENGSESAFFYGSVGEGGFQGAEGVERGGVFGAHCGFEVFRDGIEDGGHGNEVACEWWEGKERCVKYVCDVACLLEKILEDAGVRFVFKFWVCLYAIAFVITDGAKCENEAGASVKFKELVGRYGSLKVWVESVSQLPEGLPYVRGEFSLIPDLNSEYLGKLAVFLVNDTKAPIARLDYSNTRVFKQALIDGRWVVSERIGMVCGTVPEPKDLDGGKVMTRVCDAPLIGDTSGKVRYILKPPGLRPVVSDVYDGKYHAAFGYENSAYDFRCYIDTSMDPFDKKGRFDGKQIDQEREEERYLAAFTLARHCAPEIGLRRSLDKWSKSDGEMLFGGRPASAEFKQAIREGLDKKWPELPDMNGLFKECLRLLSANGEEEQAITDYVKSDIWTYLFSWMHQVSYLPLNPEEYDKMEVLKLSGNPWGADEGDILAMLQLAERDVMEGTGMLPHAAAKFLMGSWSDEKSYPTERFRNLVKANSEAARNIGVHGLAQRGNLKEAVGVIMADPKLFGNGLLDTWSNIRSPRGVIEDWEIPLVLYLFENNPSSFLTEIPPAHSKYEKNGSRVYVNLPNELYDGVVNFVTSKSAPENLNVTKNQESIRGLREAMMILDSWSKDEDEQLFVRLLENPIYTIRSRDGEGGKDAVYLLEYPVRKTAQYILKRRGVVLDKEVVVSETLRITDQRKDSE